MNLEKVNIEEFKKTIYHNYKKLFPKEERKEYNILEKNYRRGITTFFKIMEDGKFIGFFIINTVKNMKYVALDYFAILPEVQSKGYGTKAIMKLKEEYKKFDGIFIEIEKVGEGKNEEENEIRKRRARFYEKIGFQKMNFDLYLYGVLFSTYILPINESGKIENNIIDDIVKIYKNISGESKVEKNDNVIRVLS